MFCIIAKLSFLIIFSLLDFKHSTPTWGIWFYSGTDRDVRQKCFLLGDRKQFVAIIKSDLFVEQCLFWWSAGCLIRDRVMPISHTAPCMQRPPYNSCSKAIRRKCWPIMLKNDSWQSSQNETHLTGVESGKMTIDIHHNQFTLQKYHALIRLAMCSAITKNMGRWESNWRHFI